MKILGLLLAAAIAIGTVPAIADETSAPGDLFLLPAGKGDGLDGMYLRLLCQRIADTPGLARRYRHVYIAGEERGRIREALEMLTTIRDKLDKKNDKSTIAAIQNLETSVESLDLNKAALSVCASAPNAATASTSSAATAVITQYQTLPGGKAGIQFTRVHPPEIGGGGQPLAAPIVEAGYVPLERVPVDETIRSLLVRLLRVGREPIIAVKPSVDVPMQHRCADAPPPCLMQSGDLDMSVQVEKTDFLSAEEAIIAPAAQWRITDPAGVDVHEAVVASVIEAAPTRAVVRFHFRRSGLYTIRALAFPTIALGEALTDVAETRVEVRAQGVLASTYSSSHTFSVNPVAVAPFVSTIMPRASAIGDALSRELLVPGKDVAALTAALADVSKEYDGVPGTVVPAALAHDAAKVIDEDVVRKYFEAPHTPYVLATVVPTRMQWTPASGWCYGIRMRLVRIVDASLVTFNDLNAWEEACIDRADKAWLRVQESKANSKIFHTRRVDVGYETTFLRWLGREQDVAASDWKFDVASASEALIRKRLGPAIKGTYLERVKVGSFAAASERIAVSVRTPEGPTAEQEIVIEGLTAISVALRAGGGVEWDAQTANWAATAGLGLPVLWSLIELEAWVMGGPGHEDADGQFMARLSPWCALAHLVPQDTRILPFPCRSFDVGFSAGGSTSPAGALWAVDVRTRLGPLLQIGWLDVRRRTSSERTYLGSTLALTF